MLVPFWTTRVILIILLWPVAYWVRMTAVTLAGLMILMRPFIQFLYVASFVAFCAMWYKIIGGHFQPAGAFAFWPVALGAIPAIWESPESALAALSALEKEGRDVRVVYAQDRESGIKLFAKQAWYVRDSQKRLSAFLLKGSAEAYAQAHGARSSTLPPPAAPASG